jgi:hypothetical protein
MDVLIKLTGVPLQTFPEAVNDATGELMILTQRSSVPTQPLVSVSTTLICPAPAGPQRTVTQFDVELPMIVPPATVHKYVLVGTTITQYVVY